MKPLPFLALLLCACAAPVVLPPGPPAPRLDLAEARALIWQGREDDALEWLEPRGWAATGSVATERMRQDLLLARGERPALLAEIEDLLLERGPDPDLLYLRARLMSDPERRLQELLTEARRHPQHGWLALGAAATLQEFGRWEEAGEWLESAHGETAADSFRRLLQARQYAESGRLFSAWREVERDAFIHGAREALLECARIADLLGHERRRDRALAEYALRAAPGAGEPGGALDRVMERLLAEEPWMRGASLDDTLRRLDDWAKLAGAPSGWSEQPRYEVFGVAELVQPESFRGGVAAAWGALDRFLLIGRAPGRGVDWLFLQDARLIPLAGPSGPPVELILAARGLEPEDRTIPGGAPFHGFFLRLDLVEKGARERARELDRFDVAAIGKPAAAPPAMAGILEPMDLALRLRARRVRQGGASVRDLELAQLLVHEVAHLPETLPWASQGVPVIGLAPSVLRSLLKFDDPILFLEERAQLRALASGVETDWAFAELMDRALTPRDPYFAPYRSLLRALVERARRSGWPELHAWDTLPQDALSGLALELLRERGLEPAPRALLAAALRGLDDCQAFEQFPAEELAARLLHDGEVEP